jgi:hypothetical protein
MPLLESLHISYWYMGIVKLLKSFPILVTIREEELSKGGRGAEDRPNNHSRSSCYNHILAVELLTEEEVEECSSCISMS